jgi:hypothetical protein
MQTGSCMHAMRQERDDFDFFKNETWFECCSNAPSSPNFYRCNSARVSADPPAVLEHFHAA